MLSNRSCEPAKKEQAGKPFLEEKVETVYRGIPQSKKKYIPPSIAQKLASVKEKCNCTTFTENVRLFLCLQMHSDERDFVIQPFLLSQWVWCFFQS